MGKSLTETAKAILMNEGTALAATLRPGSASMDPPQSLGSAQLVADAPKAPGAGSNVGAAAAGMLKKDMSKPTQGARPAEIPKPMAEELEEDSEALEEGEDYVASFKEKGGVIKKGKTVRAKGAYPPKKGPVASRGAKNATVSAQLGYGKKLAEENVEEEVEISEELDQFIDALVAEGYSEDEIAQAIEENFEINSVIILVPFMAFFMFFHPFGFTFAMLFGLVVITAGFRFMLFFLMFGFFFVFHKTSFFRYF